MSSQQPLLMDVDPNSPEDELPTTSSCHALRRSTSLRTFRDTSRQRAASRQQPFARAPSSQPTPTRQDDLRKKSAKHQRLETPKIGETGTNLYRFCKFLPTIYQRFFKDLQTNHRNAKRGSTKIQLWTLAK